jgi:hypothetical protein
MLYPVIHIHSIQENHNTDTSSSFTALEYMSFILAHEVGHTLGLDEVYWGAYCDEDAFKQHNSQTAYCAMQSPTLGALQNYRKDVLNNTQSGLCPLCYGKLTTALKEFGSVYNGPVEIIE